MAINGDTMTTKTFYYYCGACDDGPLGVDADLRTRCPKHPEAWTIMLEASTKGDVLRGFELFYLTKEHLKLLRRANVEWCDAETGAPAIDPKRPYGNSSVARDVAEILGYSLGEDDEMSDARADELLQLHYETRSALQVILVTQSFETGLYRQMKKCDSTSWKKVGY